MTEKELKDNQRALSLLKKLSNPKVQLPTKEAKEALKILRSLQDNLPQKMKRGYVTAIKNPVTGVLATAETTDQGKSISFSNLDTNLKRPKKPNSRTQLMGIQATINQLIDELPTKRNPKPGQTKDASRYTFEAIRDGKDIRKEVWTGRPTNQRAAAYSRMTGGAFQGHLNKEGATVGHGERIDRTTWQPRSAGGRYGKYVQFDPTDVVKQLGKIGSRKAFAQGLSAINPQAGRIALGVMALDDYAKQLTGKSPTKMLAKHIDQRVKNNTLATPMTLMINR